MNLNLMTLGFRGSINNNSMNTLKHVVVFLLLLLNLNNISFAQGNFTYILTLNEYSCPTNRTTIVETHNKYYIVTDIFVPGYKYILCLRFMTKTCTL